MRDFDIVPIGDLDLAMKGLAYDVMSFLRAAEGIYLNYKHLKAENSNLRMDDYIRSIRMYSKVYSRKYLYILYRAWVLYIVEMKLEPCDLYNINRTCLEYIALYRSKISVDFAFRLISDLRAMSNECRANQMAYLKNKIFKAGIVLKSEIADNSIGLFRSMALDTTVDMPLKIREHIEKVYVRKRI